MDPDGPGFPHASNDIDLALAALMKGLPEIAADELETLLNDLPMPEPGAKDGISVKEALELSTHPIQHVIWYGFASGHFADDGSGGAWTLHCQQAYYTRLCQ